MLNTDVIYEEFTLILASYGTELLMDAHLSTVDVATVPGTRFLVDSSS